jgi:ubiquinone/menaquinone biosynthesis C-methylase UbiE
MKPVDLRAEYTPWWISKFALCCQSTRRLNVLDLGCGEGRLTPALADEFGGRVVGVEPCEIVRRRAVDNAPHPRVRYLDGSAQDIPLPDRTCDVVIMCRVLDKVLDQIPEQDHSQVAAEIARILRPGGRLVAHNLFSDGIQDPDDVGHFPSVEHVIALFTPAGFTQLPFDTDPWVLSEYLDAEKFKAEYDLTNEEVQQSFAKHDEKLIREHTLIFEFVDTTTRDEQL